MSHTLEDRAREIDTTVKGFLIPIMYRDDPETGRRLHGLGPEDFKKVTEGYACPECLAEFNTYLMTCPICRFTRDLEQDIVSAPRHWVQHLKDREERYAPETPTERGIAEGALDRVGREVEQVPLSKLRKRPSKGRARRG